MADNDTPNRAANKDKAEGERWKSNDNVVPESDGNAGHVKQDDGDKDDAGGISNRSLGEEVDNQNSLPARGQRQSDERSRNNEDLER
jgi:hypothetical protein